MHEALERGGKGAMKFMSCGVWLWRLHDAMVSVPHRHLKCSALSMSVRKLYWFSMLWALALLGLSSGESFAETCDHHSALQVRNVTSAIVPLTEWFPEQPPSDVYFASEEPRLRKGIVKMCDIDTPWSKEFGKLRKPWSITARHPCLNLFDLISLRIREHMICMYMICMYVNI